MSSIARLNKLDNRLKKELLKTPRAKLGAIKRRKLGQASTCTERLCKGMVLKHSLVSIPSGFPILISSNHSTDLNINNKIRALVLIHSIDDLKVSVRGNSNMIPWFL